MRAKFSFESFPFYIDENTISQALISLNTAHLMDKMSD